MAFTFLSDKNWSDGGVSQWDSETDSSSYLNVRSYKWLADRKRALPYRGAYAAEIDFGIKSTSTNAAYVAETGDLDTACAADGGAYCRFYVYFEKQSNWTMANNDEFTLLGLYASTTEEAAIHVKYSTASGYQLIATDGTGTATCSIEFDRWLCLEAYFNIDKGAENDGTIDFYLDGNQVESQITSADQGGITEYRYGCVGPDAGTTSGRFYLGPIVFDDARLYPHHKRFAFNREFSLTEQLFVGPGQIDSATLLTTGASNDLKLFDTDLGGTAVPEDGFLVNLNIGTHTSVEGPIQFDRGCYAVLAGTTPRANVVIRQESGGPPYFSDGGMRRWAARA